MKSHVGFLVLLAVVGLVVYFLFRSAIAVPHDQIMVVKYDEFYYRVLESGQNYFIPFWEEKYVYPRSRVLLDSVQAITKDGVVTTVQFSFSYNIQDPHVLMFSMNRYTHVYDFPKFRSREDLENYCLVMAHRAILTKMFQITYEEYMRGKLYYDIDAENGLNFMHTCVVIPK